MWYFCNLLYFSKFKGWRDLDICRCKLILFYVNPLFAGETNEQFSHYAQNRVKIRTDNSEPNTPVIANTWQ